MKTIGIFKAHGFQTPLESLTIIIENEIPIYAKQEDLYAQFLIDAEELEKTLLLSLPGGTYDRLCGLMLKRKSSHFVVPLGGPR